MIADETITASPMRYPQYFVFVSVIALANVVLIALSFTPWFGGTAKAPGLADTLFGSIRLGGFRADIVWLFFSSIALFFAGISAAVTARQNRRARRVAILCGVEVFSFAFYLFFSLISGLLYFG
jgi:hypothetical protein